MTSSADLAQCWCGRPLPFPFAEDRFGRAASREDSAAGVTRSCSGSPLPSAVCSRVSRDVELQIRELAPCIVAHAHFWQCTSMEGVALREVVTTPITPPSIAAQSSQLRERARIVCMEKETAEEASRSSHPLLDELRGIISAVVSDPERYKGLSVSPLPPLLPPPPPAGVLHCLRCTAQPVRDGHDHLVPLCETLEMVFRDGLKR